MLTLNTEKGDRWLLDAYGHFSLQPGGKKENDFDVGVGSFSLANIEIEHYKIIRIELLSIFRLYAIVGGY